MRVHTVCEKMQLKFIIEQKYCVSTVYSTEQYSSNCVASPLMRFACNSVGLNKLLAHSIWLMEINIYCIILLKE
ncbi:hypothetical protein XENTR_v10000470 [Xenopus tropicalis]|nr:hypothetical protein XENTR_v10000470 [Xenopus tropicalis]